MEPMRGIRLPGGGAMFVRESEADEAERLVAARQRFALGYMAEKGWGDDPAALTFEQILEIRAQPGWKNA